MTDIVLIYHIVGIVSRVIFDPFGFFQSRGTCLQWGHVLQFQLAPGRTSIRRNRTLRRMLSHWPDRGAIGVTVNLAFWDPSGSLILCL